MGAFAKITIFTFILIGVFALIFSFIPNAFFQASYEPSIGIDRDVVDYLALANMTVYNSTGNDNMTYPYSSYRDHPDAPQFDVGLPEGQYLEVLWGKYPLSERLIEFWHIEEMWGGSWLNRIDYCFFVAQDGTEYPGILLRSSLVDEYNPGINGSAFDAYCDHIVTSVIFTFNQTKYADIGSAWDGGEIAYYFSYSVDQYMTGIGAWGILGQLLTFQNPDLGISGDGGSILNSVIAIPLWILIGIALLYIALAVIPLIPGLND